VVWSRLNLLDITKGEGLEEFLVEGLETWGGLSLLGSSSGLSLGFGLGLWDWLRLGSFDLFSLLGGLALLTRLLFLGEETSWGVVEGCGLRNLRCRVNLLDASLLESLV